MPLPPDPRVARIIQRAEKEVQRSAIRRAINCYEGFFRYDPTCQIIHNKVGALYLMVNDKVKAGKHFYFEETLSKEEKASLMAFEKAYGYSPTLLLRKLMYFNGYRLRKLTPFAQNKLSGLIELAIKECGTIPKFLVGPRNHLKKIRRPSQ